MILSVMKKIFLKPRFFRSVSKAKHDIILKKLKLKGNKCKHNMSILVPREADCREIS